MGLICLIATIISSFALTTHAFLLPPLYPQQDFLMQILDRNNAAKPWAPGLAVPPTPVDTGCKCDKQRCECCEVISNRRLHFKHIACAELEYLPSDISLHAVLELDNIVVYNRTLISVRNPPPLCEAIVRDDFLSACLRFYDLDVKNQTASGCAEFEAEVVGHDVINYKLGCFSMPL